MADLQSPPVSLTVTLPAELVAELEQLAKDKNVRMDEVVREACLAYTEPHEWQRAFRDWLQAHPDPRPAEVDGTELHMPQSGARPA